MILKFILLLNNYLFNPSKYYFFHQDKPFYQLNWTKDGNVKKLVKKFHNEKLKESNWYKMFAVLMKLPWIKYFFLNPPHWCLKSDLQPLVMVADYVLCMAAAFSCLLNELIVFFILKLQISVFLLIQLNRWRFQG